MEAIFTKELSINLHKTPVDQLMDLEKLRTFKSIWRKQTKTWVLENIDEHILICAKISKEINEMHQELKEAKKKCIDFEAQIETLKNESFGEIPVKKIKILERRDIKPSIKETARQIVD